ncbi:MAG: hypothetical protein AAFW84_34595 [Cyanobacteria bacterium J06635_15]
MENLSLLITEVDVLRAKLRYQRWDELTPWCDDGHPTTCDGGALERLIERLCIVAVDRGVYG